MPPLPTLPSSHLGLQSSNNDSITIRLAAPSYQINGDLDKAKGVAPPPEEPNMDQKKLKRLIIYPSRSLFAIYFGKSNRSLEI